MLMILIEFEGCFFWRILFEVVDGGPVVLAKTKRLGIPTPHEEITAQRGGETHLSTQ